MESTSPAAGWYSDPSGKVMERWWDGSAWSDQMRAYNAPMAAPAVAESVYAPLPPAVAAPIYASPPPGPPTVEKPARGLGNGGIFVTWLFLGVFSLIFAWYSTRISGKAKWVWTGLVAAEVAVIVVIVAVAFSAGTGGVNTSVVQQFVTSEIPAAVTGVADAPSDETVNVQNVGCVQATGNTWTCTATYQVSAPSESINQNFSATLDVTCDSTGTCSFPSFQPLATQ